MIVPTPRLLVLIALGIPLAAIGLVIPGFELVVIPYDVLLLVLALGTARLAIPASQLQVRRACSPVLSVRVANPVELEVHNDGPGRGEVRFRDEPPDIAVASQSEFETLLGPDAILPLKYDIRPTARGATYFPGTFARIVAPLGLVEIQTRFVTQQPVRVYPNVKAVKEFELLKQRGRLSLMGVRKSRIKGLGTEFESLRDYNDDDYRRIDWKSTARRGKLVVRDFEQERNQAVIVCMDMGRKMLSEANGVAKIDHALDAALMLIHAATSAGDQAGLLIFGDIVRKYIPPKKGSRHAGLLLDAYHNLAAEAVESNYQQAFGYLTTRWKRRALVVVFTDVEDKDEANELVTALSPLLRRHIVFVVRAMDSRLKELTVAHMDSLRSMSQTAAAVWYHGMRGEAEAVLRAAGVQSIQAEPEGLAVALVSSYLKVKELSAL